MLASAYHWQRGVALGYKLMTNSTKRFKTWDIHKEIAPNTYFLYHLRQSFLDTPPRCTPLHHSQGHQHTPDLTRKTKTRICYVLMSKEVSILLERCPVKRESTAPTFLQESHSFAVSRYLCARCSSSRNLLWA